MSDFERPDPLAKKARSAVKLINCPSCNQDMPEEAVLCVKCGYNRQLKKKVKTAFD